MSKTGLGEQTGDRTFLSIKGRDFVLRGPNPETPEEIQELLDDGYKARKWKNEVAKTSGVAYEKRFPSITGQLKQTFEREGNYDHEQVFVVFGENGDSYQFSAKKFMNSQVENLMNRMCNDMFDPSEVVKVVPYKKKKESGNGYNEGVAIYKLDDKKRFAVLVPKAFTVAEPGDMPPWNKTTKAKKTVWDNDDAIMFLDGILDEKMKDVPEADFSTAYPPEEVSDPVDELTSEDEPII